MTVKPYQIQFTAPDITEDNTCYGIPKIETLYEAEQTEDGSYVFHTHDRRGSCQPGPFYQVVFRITDASPFKKEELALTIDRNIYKAYTEPVCNDLYYDAEYDLWYQRTKYVFNKKTGKWKMLAGNDKEALNVESITTSGVFKLSVMRNGQQLYGEEENMPWIYILPSSVSKDEYIQMLSDLLELNEQLIRKDNSSVGSGSVARIEAETDALNREAEATEALCHAILNAIKLPSELLGKEYIKTTINKVHHFDPKILRDYIKYGMSGKISGAVYYENHNTYENRVIKYVLQMFKKRNPTPVWRVLSKEEIAEKKKLQLEAALELLTINKLPYSYQQKQFIAESISNSIDRKNENNIAKNNLENARRKLVSVLDENTDWFSNIDLLINLSGIRATTKFISNRYYSEIYRLITENFIDRPFFNAAFDVNAFGVNSTHLVYEYWVFYKLLTTLQSIGFEFDFGEELKEHFMRFTRNQMLEPMQIPMHRTDKNTGRTVEIEVGYNNPFLQLNEQQNKNSFSRTPDYYIRVIHGDKSHWYFLDAKYKQFCIEEKEKTGLYYIEEIYEVAVKKYILDMGKIFDSNPEYKSSANDIKGSYIAMASLNDNLQLSERDRLFGYDYRVNQMEVTKNKGAYKRPKHRYGAIILSPYNDTELVTLFQMIFEFLETNNKKLHPNLSWCWRCNSTSVYREADKTGGDREKYYTTCPVCGDFRVITHCSCSVGKHMMIKHADGNYHFKDDSGSWAFVCPACGDKIGKTWI